MRAGQEREIEKAAAMFSCRIECCV
jgi:hypothetical protein